MWLTVQRISYCSSTARGAGTLCDSGENAFLAKMANFEALYLENGKSYEKAPRTWKHHGSWAIGWNHQIWAGSRGGGCTPYDRKGTQKPPKNDVLRGFLGFFTAKFGKSSPCDLMRTRIPILCSSFTKIVRKKFFVFFAAMLRPFDGGHRNFPGQHPT